MLSWKITVSLIAFILLAGCPILLHCEDVDPEELFDYLKDDLTSKGFSIVYSGSGDVGMYRGGLSSGERTYYSENNYFVIVLVDYYDRIPDIYLRFSNGEETEIITKTEIENGVAIAMSSIKLETNYTGEYIGYLDSPICQTIYMIIAKK